MQIQIPNWNPRDYQRELFEYFQSGGKRAVEVWHRRAGKDAFCLHLAALMGMLNPANYWHMLPKATQARKAIWEGINPRTGLRLIDEAFPKEIRTNTRDQEMMIKFKNGATWQLVGSDNYDTLVGSPPLGVVFSEYSLCDPAAWDYIRPILLENNGWAAFIYTARGKNHGYKLYEMAKNNPTWHAKLLTVDDTKREDGTPVITPEMIQEERDSGMSEDMILQEYYCSFSAGVVGSFYSRQLELVEKDGRMTTVPYDPTMPVQTFWDIGINDQTAIWFGQKKGITMRWIDYQEWKDTSLIEISREVSLMPYRFGMHYGPHDLRAREISTGKTREEFARSQGIDFSIVKNIAIADGIEAARYLIGLSIFDEEKCKHGIDALYNYRKQWDEKRHIYLDKPLHDWSSHGADAFRMAGVTYRNEPDEHDFWANQSTQRTAVSSLRAM